MSGDVAAVKRDGLCAKREGGWENIENLGFRRLAGQRGRRRAGRDVCAALGPVSGLRLPYLPNKDAAESGQSVRLLAGCGQVDKTLSKTQAVAVRRPGWGVPSNASCRPVIAAQKGQRLWLRYPGEESPRWP